jgi:hypothetical protein
MWRLPSFTEDYGSPWSRAVVSDERVMAVIPARPAAKVGLLVLAQPSARGVDACVGSLRFLLRLDRSRAHRARRAKQFASCQAHPFGHTTALKRRDTGK